MSPAASFDMRFGDCAADGPPLRHALLQHGHAVLRGFVTPAQLQFLSEVANAAAPQMAGDGSRIVPQELFDRLSPDRSVLVSWPAPMGYRLLEFLLGPGYRLSDSALVMAGPSDSAAGKSWAAAGLQAWLPLQVPEGGAPGSMQPGDVLLLQEPRMPMSAVAAATSVPGASLALTFAGRPAALAPGRSRDSGGAAAFQLHLARLQELVGLGIMLARVRGMDAAAATGRLQTVLGEILQQALPSQLLPQLREALGAAGLVPDGNPPWPMPERDGPIVPAPALSPAHGASFGLCMVARDQAGDLPQALAGIAGQWRAFDRIVLVDDASHDDTHDLLTAFARGRPGAEVLRNATPLGPSASLREAQERLATDYLAWAAADGWMMPGMLHALAAAAVRCPRAGLLLGETGILSGDGRRPARAASLAGAANHLADLPERLNPWELPVLFACRGLRFGAAWIVRTEALDRVGGFQAEDVSPADPSALLHVLLRFGAALVPQRLAVMPADPEGRRGRSCGGIQRSAAQTDAMLDRLLTSEAMDIRQRLAATPGLVHEICCDADPFASRLVHRPHHWDLLVRSLWWGERHGGMRGGSVPGSGAEP
ncbi:glycosyltransferase family 2 protein [Marinibaculum pumilum]|uniref:Glycosyltransferase family 2 protein n=1 Tax=Marinibaculum pumilum TaxID=1766165 RepID=A0ABV7KV51_9PROT